MIGTVASIPVRVFMCNKIDVVNDGPSYGTKITGVVWINKSDHLCYTEWEVEDMSFVGIISLEIGINIHLINEVSFHGIYALARTIMKHWRPSLFVNKDLELFLHFQVDPVNYQELRLKSL
ncbi:hypothetical protein V6N13_041551 [Hibiscus sabdariffa]|uniref:Uncharacterized protein n=1 Tax=Hibiscus sabdariffa TaxID=183260 RepID=A0ABR2RBM4_9ROSI